MVDLHERLNPDTTALVIGSGRGIYVWAYGRPQCIATRGRHVQTLALHNGRVVDGGNYNGVRDTVEGTIVAGGFNSWRRIASRYGMLYGAIQTESPDFFGIWDVVNQSRVTKRTGLTNVLVGMPRLLDAGDYPYGKLKNFVVAADRNVYSTLYNDRVFFKPDPYGIHPYKQVRAAVEHTVNCRKKGKLMFAIDSQVVTPTFNCLNHSFLFTMSKRASKLYGLYANYPSWRKKLWEEFRQLLRDASGKVPDEFRTMHSTPMSLLRRFDRSLGYCYSFPLGFGNHGRSLELRDLDFEQACHTYVSHYPLYPKREPGGRSKYRGASEEQPLASLIYDASCWWERLHNREYRIRALAEINTSLAVGDVAGRLNVFSIPVPKEPLDPALLSPDTDYEISDLIPGKVRARDVRGEIAYRFPRSVYALLSIPREVYERDLKPRILRSLRRRAVFARRGSFRIKTVAA